MRKTREDVFVNKRCPYCQYQYEDSCLVYSDCEDCPMYFKPRQDSDLLIHHCHCLAPVTTEERKSGKCKFFKEKDI